jgi:hypothetical protein
VGRIGRLGAFRIAAAALASIAAFGLPAFASSHTVTLAGGTSLTVWEQHGRVAPGRGQDSSFIGYSVTDAAGTHLGIVPMTADAARDRAPCLALDETGSAVLVWSRFDGSNRKIAYARFSGGAWANAHYLTFGPGDDDEPRIATSQTGSFLFFVGQGDRYQFAPFDMVGGRLFAAPGLVNLGTARQDIDPVRTPGSIVTYGSTDVPVVSVKAPDKKPGGNYATRILRPGQTTIQASVDVPVVNCRNKAIIWGVGSSGECRGIVLVIPARDLKTAFVFRFTNGPTSLLQRVSLPEQAVEGFGASLAASYLPIICY